MTFDVLILEHPRISSEKHFNDIANTPLWSCLLSGYAAAALEQKRVPVTLLDANQRRLDFEQTADAIIKRSPHLLCLHTVYFWEHTGHLIHFLTRIRQLGFSGHINLFGFFPSLSYPTLLNAIAAVDSVAVGECEQTLVALACQLAAKAEWRDVHGLAVRNQEGRAVLTPRRPASDPDIFPFPVRHHMAGETAGLLSSRGCYNHCRFCPVPAFYNNGPMWRGRDIVQVVEEISVLKRQGITDFYFLDPNFIGPGRKGRERAIRLSRLLKPLNITFGMETRANDLEPTLLSELRAAGLQSLLIGLESGSARVLGGLDKQGSVAVGEAALAMCRAAGIEPEVGFLMFVPDSTLADLRENLDFLVRNELLDRLDRTANLLCHRQIIFRGTSGYRLFKAQGRIQSTGPLGFQVEVAWVDEKVKWIADVIGYACLQVLKETGRSTSPLYWQKNRDWQACRSVNDYLVELFQQCLQMLRSQSSLVPISHMTTRIKAELGQMINQLTQN